MKTKQIVNQTNEFKNSVRKVVFAISLFFMLYLFLIALSVSLLVLSFYAGMFVFSKGFSIITFAIGAGLIVLGVMFFIFLIKFIFVRYKDENPYRVEIFPNDHPKLFNLIAEVSEKVETDFPKKVFLRHDVNASVFYNSSFWSLFLPVRKNLDIGLGLMNSLNVGEFRAVLSHEFGHFSQKSMRLGSYIYIVNNVIYNQVYQEDNWDKSIEKLAGLGGIFGFFIVITHFLARMVRFILRKAYSLINLMYMKLSREMEYQADEISAIIGGKNNAIHALRRIELCNIAFNQTLNTLNVLAKEKQISTNIYTNYTYEIERLVNFFKLKTDNGLPIIQDKDLDENTTKPRVLFEDQWATHPAREEREKRIMQCKDFNVGENNSTCWTLLNDPQKIQNLFSERMYEIDFGDTNDFNPITNEKYAEYYINENKKLEINEVYKGFYFGRFLSALKIDDLLEKSDVVELSDFESVYNKLVKLKAETIQNNYNDLNILYQILNKQIDTKYFEFDNIKYHRKSTKEVISEFEKEIEVKKEELIRIDEVAFLFNLKLATQISEERRKTYLNKYKSLEEVQEEFQKYQEFIGVFSDYHYTIFNKENWNEDEMSQFNRDLSKFEQDYKAFLKSLELDKVEGLSISRKDIYKNYVHENFFYIKLSTFDFENFSIFVDLIYDLEDVVNDQFQLTLKEFTDFQVGMYKEMSINEIHIDTQVAVIV